MPLLFIRLTIFPVFATVFFNKCVATRHCEAKIIMQEAVSIQCWWSFGGNGKDFQIKFAYKCRQRILQQEPYSFTSIPLFYSVHVLSPISQRRAWWTSLIRPPWPDEGLVGSSSPATSSRGWRASSCPPPPTPGVGGLLWL